MVTSTRKIVGLPDVKNTLEKYGYKNTDKIMKELTNLPRKRIKAEPAPAGSIGLRQAGKKYGIHYTSIQKWVKNGVVKVVKRTDNWLYVNEQSVVDAINNSKRLPHIS